MAAVSDLVDVAFATRTSSIISPLPDFALFPSSFETVEDFFSSTFELGFVDPEELLALQKYMIWKEVNTWNKKNQIRRSHAEKKKPRGNKETTWNKKIDGTWKKETTW